MGRLREEDLEELRTRIDIVAVLEPVVTLRSSGSSLVGLCPFHEEKTPSFAVDPGKKLFFCHGCQQGGDALEFLTRHEGLSFVEAAEQLADQFGVVLRTEDNRPPTGPPPGQRRALLEANQVAARYFAAALLTPAAQHARTYLIGRRFGRAEAELFGLGYAPADRHALVLHLRDLGFTGEQMVAAGLAKHESGGLVSRFRDRLIWPIRQSGRVIAFGARSLAAADAPGSKYINSPESPLYRKGEVLYGLDVAASAIGRQRCAVVVEGYSDVMALHSAGIATAVALCGTAFSTAHARQLTRLVGSGPGQRIVFALDDDTPGTAAAAKVLATAPFLAPYAYVAVNGTGLDPCEIRQRHGDEALHRILDRPESLVAFALRTAWARLDLHSPEGKSQAISAAAEILRLVSDPVLQAEHTERVTQLLDVDPRLLQPESPQVRRVPAAAAGSAGTRMAERLQREALKVLVQDRRAAGAVLPSMRAEWFTAPGYREVAVHLMDLRMCALEEPDEWTHRVLSSAGGLSSLLTGLAVETLHVQSDDLIDYARQALGRLENLDRERTLRALRHQAQTDPTAALTAASHLARPHPPPITGPA